MQHKQTTRKTSYHWHLWKHLINQFF